MPIVEIIKAVGEAAKETSKEISKEVSKEAQKFMNDLDKPLNEKKLGETELSEGELSETELNETELNEISDLKDGDFDTWMDELDKPLNSDVSDVSDKQGGRFGDIFKEGEGETIEVHHMPADSVTELSRNDGPAIRMDKADHRETASCGNSREAREYREYQKELIENDKFDEAVQMDIDDIREKFGSKYDDAINEMLEYVDELKKEGKI